MNYFKYEIHCEDSFQEILIAFLADLPFDSFDEHSYGFNAYLPEKDYDPSLDLHLDQLQNSFQFTYERMFIKGENWNTEWEKNFSPIVVDEFCGIRANFHEPIPGVQFDLIINPKMAFGTGHHETTRMMIRQMEKIDVKGTRILDFGTGTGVLAILAVKLGASYVEGIEIEVPACENAVENCAINNTDAAIKIICGGLDKAESIGFDIILANINRNVILESINTLHSLLKEGGILLTSGYILEDIPKMEEAFLSSGFSLQNRLEEGNWVCHQVRRP
ncbi:MAG: 50S ribosomal protein L11 methyltransferase [Saprospiraceae bacterium]|nr:50S ribosomal protein L11 methyltransferase [Saprospiraceae bacterium]